jgi:hypothetical protein
MGTRTAYNVRSNSPELGMYCFSFLGNGAAAPLATQIFGAKGLLAAPFATLGINRTGAGAYTINLFDGFRGAQGIGASGNVAYQAILHANVTILQAVVAAPFVGTILFTGTDPLTAKQIKFVITPTASSTPTDITSSMLCTVQFGLLNSSGQ